LVTTRSTVPALPAGAVAVSDVALATLTEPAAAAPNDTLAPAVKPLPVIVTAVPPATGPDDGPTAVTAGGGADGAL
jgi:hypothetical protein